MPFCEACRSVRVERRLSRNPADNSWKSAFFSSPGPESGRCALLLGVKGAFMGAADTVPGVSGGTIALITGIYEDFLAAVKSVNARVLARLVRLDLKGAVAEVHIRFLLSLFCGIGVAVVSLARLMNYLLHHYPVPTWSFFFGLIAASIWVVGRRVKSRSAVSAAAFCIGAGAAYVIVGMVPAQTPETHIFVFLSGMLAVCAMILPGLSGAFILLILGKYEFIVAVLKNPLMPSNLAVLGIFVAGCALGLIGFARVLKFLLDRYHNAALACLTGLMLGSMRKIWPWKEPLLAGKVHGELVVLKEKNVLPDGLWPEAAVPVLLMAAGFALVIFLDRLGRRKGMD
ncbi:MAG: DUF368 domain-containing protein [Desulfobacteraceae bacterium]|nr:DUF368 domain-containing protein [Desulfobacteraceae bacterium]